MTPSFNPNWGAIAQILGSALAAPQGQWAQGAAQGAQMYQAQQQQKLEQEYRQQQLEIQRQQADQQAEAYRRQQEADQAWQRTFNPQPVAGPGGPQANMARAQDPFPNVSPQDKAMILAAGREAGLPMLWELQHQSPEQKRPIEIGGLLVDPNDPTKVLADYSQQVADLKRAGAQNTNVSVNMPKAILKGDEKLLEIGAEGSAQAQEIMPLFDIAETAAKNFSQSGPLGGGALFIERGKNYLGLPNNASSGEVLQGMQTRLGTLLRVPGSGATSNMEMSLYMQGVPSLLNSQEGNIALAKIGKKLVKRRMDNFQRLQAYVQQNGTSVGYEPDDTPALTSDEMQLLLGGADAAPAEDAPTATGPGGQKLILRNGKWEPM